MTRVLFLALLGGLTAECRAADKPVDYERDVKPIFQAHCYRCHGPDEQESGLRLDTGRAAQEGGNAGRGIVPGDSAASLLIKAVTGAADATRMPPEEESEPLAAEQIALLERWIAEGAKFPADERPAPSAAQRSAHWSFRPIVRPAVPETPRADEPPHPVDAFMRAKLQPHGFVPSPEADRGTLIRRLSFDLIGLPPTLAEVESFVNDGRPGGYERLVERLLASPHYGERWGRWWLDQARYADSDGYSNDGPRQMWRYRDWVIDSLNRDLPFDRFAIAQIAGDLLPEAVLDQVIATGFHRNTQTYSEADSATEEYRVENVVDRVHTTGVVFLGLTLGCARCHDHKFDPISQKEFFELYAFFNNQDEPQITVPIDTIQSATTTVLVMKERIEPRATHIHIRGDYVRPGREVAPGLPAVLPPLPAGTARPNRLDLARWLVAPENPLTPRVIVNRVWQVYFGTGIVETEDDFGTQGTPPTHPELLDWLASEFITPTDASPVDGTGSLQAAWSLKRLHRLIVMSATYRQASDTRPDLLGLDPRNKLLSRQNRLRLDAELVRDAALEAAGLLSRKLKGPSVFPPQPQGVMRFTQNSDRQWSVSPGEDRYRRGMYTFFWRLTPHPFLTLFNAPESSVACTRRDRSNTPLQALTLLNDEAFVEAAQALAVRILLEAPAETNARIAYAFRLCLARAPRAEEIAVVQKLLDAERADRAAAGEPPRFAALARLPEGTDPHEVTAWTSAARTLLNLDEFITRE